MFFSKFDKIFRVSIYKKKGQVAPFLIAVIAVLIIALMVTVNIGRVGLTRTTTSNAADAGALAGGTIHTETLNALADINTQMIADYFAEVASFLIPFSICKENLRFYMYLAFVAAQSAQFAFAWMSGVTGYETQAPDTAKQLAFSNVGVDEPKPRNTGESYDDWVKRDSPFGSWMNAKGYQSSDQYTWQDKGIYPDYTPRTNWVRVDVDYPSFPGLLPMPGVLVGVYMDTIAPYFPCECNLTCMLSLVAWMACVTATGGIPIPEEFMADLITCCPVWCPWDCPSIFSAEATGMAHGIFPILNLVPAWCGGTAWVLIFYWVPIAAILDIVSDNPEIGVTVSRYRPNSNLGLWNMSYGTISSEGRAKTEGGHVGFWPDPDYDTKLIEAH